MAQATPEVHLIDHPLIHQKLTTMRRTDTPPPVFRSLLREVGMLMAFEVTRDLPTSTETIETPLTAMEAPVVSGRLPALVSVLRAGNGLLDGLLEVVPGAPVGHVGMRRDPETLEAIEYYCKMPPYLDERQVLVLDPMLATGHTAVASVTHIRQLSPRSVKFVSLLAAPEGIAHFHEHHPDVPIYTCAVDSHLNDHGYIVPGLGDAGDRIYGTT